MTTSNTQPNSAQSNSLNVPSFDLSTAAREAQALIDCQNKYETLIREEARNPSKVTGETLLGAFTPLLMAVLKLQPDLLELLQTQHHLTFGIRQDELRGRPVPVATFTVLPESTSRVCRIERMRQGNPWEISYATSDRALNQIRYCCDGSLLARIVLTLEEWNRGEREPQGHGE